MNLCACGCGAVCAKSFVKGHHFRKRAERPAPTQCPPIDPSPSVAAIDSPPPHPQPFDHMRWRIADERPGVDLNAPWVRGYCIECKGPTWTHDPRLIEKQEVICETCMYFLMDELATRRVNNQNRAKPYFNPFE